MLKKLSLPIIAGLLVVLQPSHMTATQSNYGYISSWNININTSLYNSGSILGYNVDIIGHTQNYKSGKISARSSLRINDFKISIDKLKNKNASIVVKYPNGYINIFCKNKKINMNAEYEIERAKDVPIYRIASNFKIESSKGSHLELLDGVIHILSDELDEPIEEGKPKDAAWYTKIANKILYYPMILMRSIIWKKQEFIKIEDSRYEVLKPNKIIVDDLANEINLVNEGSIFIGKIKLEIS